MFVKYNHSLISNDTPYINIWALRRNIFKLVKWEYTPSEIENFYEELRRNFNLSDDQKRMAYIEAFNLRQKPGESYSKFVSRTTRYCN